MYENMGVIGIIEESKDRVTFRLLKDILNRSSYKISYENKKKNIVILNKKGKGLMIVDMTLDSIEAIDKIGLDFNILIHTFLTPMEYRRAILRNIFTRADNIIVNSDESGWTYFIEDNKEAIVITYGFSNKSTVNISSYNIQESIKANICLQRELRTGLGDIIEPCEIRVKINSLKKQDLYSAMSILTSALLLGVDSKLIERPISFDLNII